MGQPNRRARDVSPAERLKGSLLAGACGDALGAPLEFLSLSEIRDLCGPDGPVEYVPGAMEGRFTDDTQMTLFTAEGIVRARTRSMLARDDDLVGVVRHAYLRWLSTQVGPDLVPSPPESGAGKFPDGWLVGEEVMHRRSAPGMTCMHALLLTRRGTPEAPLNGSKGCGAVMRVAPAGVFDLLGDDSFRRGCEFGALTHGHPTGWLSAGFLAATVARLLAGESLDAALDSATGRLKERPKHEETLRAVDGAREAALQGPPSAARVESVGEGWIAEEALAIAVYSALAATDLQAGLRLAVTHGGDSDSTGAIAGNLLGAMFGPESVPTALSDELDGRGVVERVADDLVAHVLERRPGIERTDLARYPAW